MVLFPTEANIDVIPAEASINAAAGQRYHEFHCRKKLSYMSPLNKVIIGATSCKSYHWCCCRSKPTIAIIVLLPTKANTDAVPAEASINAAAQQRYH